MTADEIRRDKDTMRALSKWWWHVYLVEVEHLINFQMRLEKYPMEVHAQPDGDLAAMSDEDLMFLYAVYKMSGKDGLC